MLKAYYFLWRRDGLTRAEFIDYYENIHADLIIANLPRAGDFRRNFPVWDGVDIAHPKPMSFDALTAITFHGPEHLLESLNTYRSPPFSEIVTADELRFINRSRIRFVPVDEVIDQVPDGKWFAATALPEGAKLLRFTRRPDGMDAAEFMDRFEASEAPIVRDLFAGCKDYRRNYFRPADPFSYMTPELEAEIESNRLVNCDLVEELCFADRAAAMAAAQRLNNQSDIAETLEGMERTPAIECAVGISQPIAA